MARPHSIPRTRSARRAFAGLFAAALATVLATAGLAASPQVAHAATLPWMNTSQTPAQRAQELLSAMTVAQDLDLLHGSASCNGYAACVDAVPSLDIPQLRLSDGPAGVGDGATGVTQLPAPVAGAASWDTSLMQQYGQVIGSEAWGKGDNIVLGPTINMNQDLIDPAVAAAKAANTAVVFVDNPESEGADLPNIDLSSAQNSLITAVAAANPNTVVVVNSGSATTMPWADSVKGIIENWYPGQTDGTAIAALLFGDVNFSGKLPVTFPQSLAQVPASTAAQWPGQNGTVQYSEGVDVGYRWYDSQSLTPLFPFGFGLSYTSFSYSGLSVGAPNSAGNVAVTFTVTNTGTKAGADVAQLYVGEPSSTGEPPKSLAGFQRVTLNPGQSQQVTLTVAARSFQYWGTNGWTNAAGTNSIYVGDSSRNLPLTGQVTIGGTAPTSGTLSSSAIQLTFPAQTVGTAGSAQSVTITNTGTAAVAIGSVSTTGDFGQSNNCGSSLAAGATCTASVTFTPTAAGTRTGALTVTSNATNSPLTVSLTGTGTTASTTNLALTATMTSSGYTQSYAPSNANDNNTSTYWESTNNAFPQWLQADLGSTQSVGSITLTLPPSTSWATRTQTLSVLGSTDGANYTTLVASAGYTFNPATGNTVTIPLPAATSDRYLRLNITANTGWPAGQISEFQIYPGAAGGPANLSRRLVP